MLLLLLGAYFGDLAGHLLAVDVPKADGREKVIALLDDFVRRDERRDGGLSQLKYIQQVRKKLGLE